MKFKSITTRLMLAGISMIVLSGCVPMFPQPDAPQVFSFHETEPQWIREGNPIEFEGEQWYPEDQLEVILDTEVYLLGEYNGVQFFVEKSDVRPYNRLYTKFSKNLFRLFGKKRTY